MRFHFMLAAVASILLATSPETQTQPKGTHFLFTGDILLSRRVALELLRRKISPWEHFAELFHNAQWVSGNLEGAIGPASECQKPTPLCFATPDSAVQLLKSAGFSGVTFENNHAGDLGTAGRERTRELLEEGSLAAVDFQNSPYIAQVGEAKLALLSITLIAAADGRVQQIPSAEITKKLRRAREQADLTVVSIHWGNEYQQLADATQRAQAKWLIQQGADVIVGHHPHVVEPAECVDGHPVFFSLGNHVFDQTYPPTKEGLIADCRLSGVLLSCRAIPTQTEDWTTIPSPAAIDRRVGATLTGCSLQVKMRGHREQN